MLKTEDEIPRPCDDESSSEENRENDKDKEEYVHVGFQGVHVKDKNGEVHVGWNGIHVDDRKKGDNVHIDKNGVYVNGEHYDKGWFTHHAHFPMFLVILIAYLVIGCVWNAWHPGWLLFLLLPIWHSLVEAIEKKNANCFAYPVLATLIFFALGIFWFAWHPGWVVFLTIPLYYSLVSYFSALRRRRKKEADSSIKEDQFQADNTEGQGDGDEK